MNVEYKVTYRNVMNDKDYVDSFKVFQNAFNRYNEVKSLFELYADVKLIVETVIMHSA